MSSTLFHREAAPPGRTDGSMEGQCYTPPLGQGLSHGFTDLLKVAKAGICSGLDKSTIPAKVRPISPAHAGKGANV